MKATITIDMDNAAFADDWQQELARILDKLATSLRTYPSADSRWALRDINGNTVGEMEITA